MKLWTLEDYAAIDPNLVPKKLPAIAEIFPAYSKLNEAVKELRSAKREFNFGVVSMVLMSVMLLYCFITGFVSGEISLLELLECAGLFVLIARGMFYSCHYRIDAARKNLEKELSGRNHEFFKALFNMINK